MSEKQSQGAGGLPSSLPDDFFDTNKKSKKVQEDELVKEIEQFEKEMAVLQAESEEQLEEEFEKLQEERDSYELDQQIDHWTKIVELEKKAEELKNKPLSENSTKKFKKDAVKITPQVKKNTDDSDDDQDLDDVEDFEDKLFDWRSKKL